VISCYVGDEKRPTCYACVLTLFGVPNSPFWRCASHSELSPARTVHHEDPVLSVLSVRMVLRWQEPRLHPHCKHAGNCFASGFEVTTTLSVVGVKDRTPMECQMSRHAVDSVRDSYTLPGCTFLLCSAGFRFASTTGYYRSALRADVHPRALLPLKLESTGTLLFLSQDLGSRSRRNLELSDSAQRWVGADSRA
jgi:hypothetical protein